MKSIVIEPYTEKWADEFQKAYEFYTEITQNIDVRIEHVGSTSIVGMWAKPILDIDIIVRTLVDSKAVIKLLKRYGYTHSGDQGIPGREAMDYEQANNYITWMEHHLYVCLEGSENLENHLLLREHLRKNKEAVKAYSDIKRQLAEKFPNDINSYVDGKTELITGFLKKEGLTSAKLNRIMDINKKK